MSGILFTDVLVEGRRCDLRVEGRRIATIADAQGSRLAPRAGEEVRSGGMLTVPLAEPHVHLDATLLGARTPNVSGTLREGIANWAAVRPSLTHADVQARARETVDRYLSWGCTRIRTHVDTGSRVAAEALLDLREQLAAEGVTLQVVAFPQEGILRAPGRREAWEEVVAMGCDAVGAIPHFERTTEEGWESVRLAFELAERHGIMVDLHCDETDDPGSRNLEVVCAETLKRGWSGRVVAGHCAALHSYPAPYRAKVIELVAASGVLVVANPLDNVVLQGRYDDYPRRRGMTPVDLLWDAGVPVGFGHDSIRDPWYPLGTANLVDAAHMAAHLGHLTSVAQLQRAFRTLHADNHIPFGGPPRLDPGAPADLLHWPGDAIDVLRERPRPFVLRATTRPS